MELGKSIISDNQSILPIDASFSQVNRRVMSTNSQVEFDSAGWLKAFLPSSFLR